MKKEFLVSLVCCLVFIILLVQTLIGMELALGCLVMWSIISLIAHIYILRDCISIEFCFEEDFE
jgi:hypothetical protein